MEHSNIMNGDPVGYEYKFTGFHYDEGGWKLWERYTYSDKTTSDWKLYPMIFPSRLDAMKFGDESTFIFLKGLNGWKT